MARGRSVIVPLALLAAAFVATFGSLSFVPPANNSNAVAILVPASASLLPIAANAVDVPEQMQASSVNVATQIEVTMLGLLLGLAPVTALGLFVAAWLQFKKSPTLGV
eukprot:TRINITY_DN1054_c0_g6_i1.p2 TRINITY_DN1054_c0_g6~~TRINITY_DN1054_c0_g6_i1.p2  ORF type:complete len:108 (-),score=33.40 TRINITY_DN1054_c0_g6_i1:173-496(-)